MRAMIRNYLLMFLPLLMLTLSMEATASNEYSGVSQPVSTDFQGNRVLNLLAAGIYYRVDGECNVPDYGSVIIMDTGYYGAASVNFGGGSPSRVYWQEDTISSEIVEGELVQTPVTIWHNCEVTGLMGGEPTQVACQDNSPVFTVGSELLYLQNVKIYDGLEDTLYRFDKVTMEHNAGCFNITQIE